MTIEEIKDLIDSTIKENGAKAITGQTLNLALNEIVNAVAEAATTGGGGVKRLYVDASGGSITDPEQLASNAALYTEIVTALTNNELPPQVGALFASGEVYSFVAFVGITYQASTILLLLDSNGSQGCSLTSDGNTSIVGG